MRTCSMLIFRGVYRLTESLWQLWWKTGCCCFSICCWTAACGTNSATKRECLPTWNARRLKVCGFLWSQMFMTMSIMFFQLQAAILVLISEHVQRRWRYLYASSSSACGNIVRPILAIVTWKNWRTTGKGRLNTHRIHVWYIYLHLP